MKIRQPLFALSVYSPPCDLALIASFLQRFSPVQDYFLPKCPKGHAAFRYSIIPIIPQQHRSQLFTLFWNRIMHASLRIYIKRFKHRPNALFHCLPKDTKLFLSGFSENMIKPRNIKHSRFTFQSQCKTCISPDTYGL